MSVDSFPGTLLLHHTRTAYSVLLTPIHVVCTGTDHVRSMLLIALKFRIHFPCKHVQLKYINDLYIQIIIFELLLDSEY